MSDCNHTVADSSLRGDECAQCLREADKRGPAVKASEITLETEFDEKGHAEPWRNQLAHDLNWILGRAEYHLETSNDESDRKFAKSAIAVCARVAEFEEIKSV